MVRVVSVVLGCCIFLVLGSSALCAKCFGQELVSINNDAASAAPVSISAIKDQSSSGSLASIHYSSIHLNGGTKLNVLTPPGMQKLEQVVLNTLKSSHSLFTRYFGEIPAFATSIRILDQDTFFLLTGAPKWTNALYYQDQVMIPIANQADLDLDNLERSVRHEFTHAIIHAMSLGRCPGWLDEGLAQWAEGDENPALQTALQQWLSEHEPVPFNLLQGGFTKLRTAMVAAAYAQSLFATNTVINSFGMPKLAKYFTALRVGSDKSEAFRESFGLSEKSFEQRLGQALQDWASTTMH